MLELYKERTRERSRDQCLLCAFSLGLATSLFLSISFPIFAFRGTLYNRPRMPDVKINGNNNVVFRSRRSETNDDDDDDDYDADNNY